VISNVKDMLVKIKNIVVHNKLELIKILRANLGYTMDNCVKFAAQLDENDSMELDEHVVHNIYRNTSISFEWDRVEEPVYDPYAYQNDLDYIDAKGWYDSLPETQKEFVRTLARDFVPGPPMA
jgi:hypothetical protein